MPHYANNIWSRTKSAKETEIAPYVSYFDRTVLSKYRQSPDKYHLVENGLNGRVSLADHYANTLLPEDTRVQCFSVQFTFRLLASGEPCIAAWAADVRDLPAEERKIWEAHRLRDPRFAEKDPRFAEWVERYVEGHWGTRSGTLREIRKKVRLLRAMTEQFLGRALFRFEDNPLLAYPAAQNTNAYVEAHLRLYQFVVDGLDVKTIELLAKHLELALEHPCRTLESLECLLPGNLQDAVLAPLKKCRDVRNRKHGVPSKPPDTMDAVGQFETDLLDMDGALSSLARFLEGKFNANAEACLRRKEVMDGPFPKIVGPPVPDSKLAELEKCVGKTIKSVEFGAEEDCEERHQAEAIIFHFSDGSSLAITVGANVWNLAEAYRGLKPTNLETDIRIWWAPSPHRASNPGA